MPISHRLFIVCIIVCSLQYTDCKIKKNAIKMLYMIFQIRFRHTACKHPSVSIHLPIRSSTGICYFSLHYIFQ